jgi:hypothetical protein
MNNNQPIKRSMTRTEQVNFVQSLVDEAKRYQPGDPRRQKALTRAIRGLSGLLWTERSPHYNDALQQTLEYFCRHVDRYNPEQGTVVTWLNAYLRWRLIDLARPSREIPFSQFSKGDDQEHPFGDLPDPVDRTQASILEAVRNWVETDFTGELKSLRMPKYPQVTAQFLILHRLPPETSWQSLSKTLGVKIPTLASFYQRHCMTQLQAFGKTQGYLE